MIFKINQIRFNASKNCHFMYLNTALKRNVWFILKIFNIHTQAMKATANITGCRGQKVTTFRPNHKFCLRPQKEI